jgi:hypothetical protein
MGWKFCTTCGGPLAAALESHGPQRCDACGAEHFRNSKPCAGALIARDGRVLLARRAVEPFKGHWDIPGGFLHENEHPEDGVRREILEETGLRVQLAGLLGIYMNRSTPPNPTPPMTPAILAGSPRTRYRPIWRSNTTVKSLSTGERRSRGRKNWKRT